jgi:hypothetical protein
MTYKNGETYTGNFQDNQRHGNGTYKYKSKNIYTGDWLNDQRHGNGRMTYQNGDIYTGNWHNGTRHGNGTLTYQDGNTYTCEWHNGTRHGNGTITYKNGSTDTGTWHNGAYVESSKPLHQNDQDIQRIKNTDAKLKKDTFSSSKYVYLLPVLAVASLAYYIYKSLEQKNPKENSVKKKRQKNSPPKNNSERSQGTELIELEEKNKLLEGQLNNTQEKNKMLAQQLENSCEATINIQNGLIELIDNLFHDFSSITGQRIKNAMCPVATNTKITHIVYFVELPAGFPVYELEQRKYCLLSEEAVKSYKRSEIAIKSMNMDDYTQILLEKKWHNLKLKIMKAAKDQCESDYYIGLRNMIQHPCQLNLHNEEKAHNIFEKIKWMESAFNDQGLIIEDKEVDFSAKLTNFTGGVLKSKKDPLDNTHIKAIAASFAYYNVQAKRIGEYLNLIDMNEIDDEKEKDSSDMLRSLLQDGLNLFKIKQKNQKIIKNKIYFLEEFFKEKIKERNAAAHHISYEFQDSSINQFIEKLKSIPVALEANEETI